MCVRTTHQLQTQTPNPKPQTPYGQIIIVNKIYYSYLHVKSGAVCPQAAYDYELRWGSAGLQAFKKLMSDVA